MKSVEKGQEELSQNDSKKQQQFAIKIKQHDEIKMLQKKLTILKDGYKSECIKKKELEAQIQKSKTKMNQFQEENQRKEKKYEALTAQIKKLKDDLIQERSYKHTIYLELYEREEELRVKNIFQQGSRQTHHQTGLSFLGL